MWCLQHFFTIYNIEVRAGPPLLDPPSVVQAIRGTLYLKTGWQIDELPIKLEFPGDMRG
jgi:hypothetical protein